MNNIAKALVLSFSVVSVVGLTACQSSSATAPDAVHKLPEQHKHHKQPFNGEFKRMHKLTDEQRAEKRAEMEQRRGERKAHFEAMQKACEGKVGQNITVKVGDKTIAGSCEVHFKPNKPERVAPPQAS